VAFGLVVLIIFVLPCAPALALIPAVAIPVSIVEHLRRALRLRLLGHILTMLALVLAIGVVVDDAIVVLEAIYRHVEEGMPPLQAAYRRWRKSASPSSPSPFRSWRVRAAGVSEEHDRTALIEFCRGRVRFRDHLAFVALTLTPAMAARLLKRSKA